MLTHNCIPQKLMDTMIIPLLKNSKSDISDCNNYRPIDIPSIMSKILESAILEEYKDYFIKGNHQFGLRTKHGADQCIFIMKEL